MFFCEDHHYHVFERTTNCDVDAPRPAAPPSSLLSSQDDHAPISMRQVLAPPLLPPHGFGDLLLEPHLAFPNACCNTGPTSQPAHPPPVAPPAAAATKQASKAPPVGRKSGSTRKDRHSKIVTAQGTRDRRIRLSRDVAKKFFDLQDALSFDKPSKTVEWLLTKSSKAIKTITTYSGSQTQGYSSGSAKVESSTSGCEVNSTNNIIDVGKKSINVIAVDDVRAAARPPKRTSTASPKAGGGSESDPSVARKSRLNAGARANRMKRTITSTGDNDEHQEAGNTIPKRLESSTWAATPVREPDQLTSTLAAAGGGGGGGADHCLTPLVDRGDSFAVGTPMVNFHNTIPDPYDIFSFQDNWSTYNWDDHIYQI